MSLFQQWQQETAARLTKGEPTLLAPHVVDPRTLPDPFEVEARKLRMAALQDAFDNVPSSGGDIRPRRVLTAAELRQAHEERIAAEKRASDADAKVGELQKGIAELQRKAKAREGKILREAGEKRRAAVEQMMVRIRDDRATRSKRVLDQNELRSRASRAVAKQERQSR